MSDPLNVVLSERSARQVLDAITRHSATVELADAVLARCREQVRASQARMDETVEAVLGALDIDMPENYRVKLDGLTLHVVSEPSPQERLIAQAQHANGQGPS